MSAEKIRMFEYMQKVTIENFNGISVLLQKGIKENEIEEYLKYKFSEINILNF